MSASATASGSASSARPPIGKAEDLSSLAETTRLTLGAQSGLTELDVPLQVHAHVFRAAALYGLFVRSGESNGQLRNDVLAEIARTKQLNASFQPSPWALSPRFLSLYQTGR